MRNLSKIFKEFKVLRDNRKSLGEIKIALLKKGLSKNDIGVVLNKKKQQETEDYTYLTQEVTGKGLYSKIATIIAFFFLAFILTYMLFYFGYYAYKSFLFPHELKEGQILIDRKSWLAQLTLRSSFLAILFLSLSIPAIGAVIKRIRLLISNRKKWNYLDERMNKF